MDRYPWQEMVLDLHAPLDEKKFFKIRELARFLDLAPQTIHFRLGRGAIRSVKRTSRAGHYLIPRREVIRLLKKEGREIPGVWTRVRKKILVIEDDALIRKLMEDAFRDPELRLEVRTAATAEDGLVLAATYMPDVIVVDHALKDRHLQGDVAVRLIRNAKAFRKVKVIAMAVGRRAGEKMIAGGADLLLEKPFGLEELRRAIYSQVFAKRRIRYTGPRLSGLVSDCTAAEGARRRAQLPRGPLPVPCRACNNVIPGFIPTRGTHSVLCPKCGASTSIEVYVEDGAWRLRTEVVPKA